MYFKEGDIVDYRINNLSGTGEVVYVLDKDYYKVRLDKNNVAYYYKNVNDSAGSPLKVQSGYKKARKERAIGKKGIF